MAIKKAEAFVLKRWSFRETSLLVTVFTRENGKIKGLVKGARKEKNPLAVRFEPFTHLLLNYYEKTKSETHLISHADILSSNAFLRSRLDFFSYASYQADLLDSLFGLHDPQVRVFELLRVSFNLFQKASPMMVTRVFEAKLLDQAGFLPNLAHCTSCGRENFERSFFSSRQGGLLCAQCEGREFGSVPISKKAIEALLFFLVTPMEKAIAMPLDGQVAGELERIGRKFIEFRLEYPLKSSRFLSEVKPFIKIM
ncbi:MAG: DNA repair protein RecO [Candidatus Omnitrophica bacterium]|nr:DNA repair protein RecO [Candidatus Omnitrophota bacterium]